jgi:hypothetical protein
VGRQRQTLKLQNKMSLQVHRRYTTGIIGLERNTLYKIDKLSFHMRRLCTDTNGKETDAEPDGPGTRSFVRKVNKNSEMACQCLSLGQKEQKQKFTSCSSRHLQRRFP